MLGFIIFIMGIPSAFSFNILKQVTLLPNRNIFDSCDIIATNFMLPIGGLFIAVFAGWILTHGEKEAEIKRVENAFHFYAIWHILIKYITPIALIIVLLYTTGLLHVAE
ncbi:MAG: hypothetical protein NTZ51_11820 [Proteobacteria bacterium]|nr:hypothetical protein [Pseudomonadota bacterium]